jgi:Kef-type K+ transport system membrane component KefB
VIGIIYGPQAANILPAYIQSTFVTLGYIGLILIVFEAGLSTDIPLFLRNFWLSLVVAASGVIFSIAFSLLLLHVGFGYSLLLSFAAGASLSSTSLGTTLSLLKPPLRQTRIGSVLISAALLDDIAGLILAAIITQLSSTPQIKWQTVVRPILVSLSFAFGTPLCAFLIQKASLEVHSTTLQLWISIITLSGFVAGSSYAGTSDLFGAFLAGTFLTNIFPSTKPDTPTPETTFHMYVEPCLRTILSPVFFASIGSALPIRSLGEVDGSHRVVWRGIVYAIVMVAAKAAVGGWILVWDFDWRSLRKIGRARKRSSSNHTNPSLRNPSLPNESIFQDLPQPSEVPATPLPPSDPSPAHKSDLTNTRQALLLGFAMVTRGEVALIVAELARPLLESSSGNTEDTSIISSEAFAVVVWAILITTVGGALGVGLVLRGAQGEVRA